MPSSEPPTVEAKLAVMRVKIERIESDIESEKGTRARANEAIHRKLETIQDTQSATNKIVSMMMGGLMVLQVVLQFLRH